MKRFTFIFALLLTTATMMAEEFTMGNLTFETLSNTEVELVDADKSITSADITPTITYQGKSYSVTSIGSNAFSGCSSLTSITIPNSVTSIGMWAFANCSKLTSVTIGNSVTSIGNRAFSDCTRLTSVTIPNSVTSIGSHAFSGCKSLTSMVVESGNSTYDSRENCNAIIKTTTNTLIAGCQNTIIPNSVTSIGGTAFAGCSGLTSVTIPNSVTSIGDEAFAGCSSLTSITWNAKAYDISSYESNPFYNIRSQITSFTIGDSIEHIPAYLCYGMSKIKSVTIPESVKRIGLDAFTSTKIYENPRNWKNGVLYISNCLIAVDKNIAGEYKVKENTRLIADEAFSGCESLFFVSIPESVTTIGYGVFSGCSTLKSVRLGKSVTSIGDFAFVWCESLKSVFIPNSVTSIGRSAFYGCSSLKSVTIPQSVTHIGTNAFPEHTQIIRK